MRKEIEITIDKGRDAGKKFKIIEMSALQADRWATKTLMALGRTTDGGILSVASMGIEGILKSLGSADYEKVEPLLQELLECASFVKDGTCIQLKAGMVDSIIEDWTTLFKLRWEALNLVIDFLVQGSGENTT